MTLFLSLFACAEMDHTELGVSASEKAFGGKIKNIRIRERNSGAGYRYTVSGTVGGLASDEAEEVRGLELVVDDDATIDLEPVGTQHRATMELGFDEDPSGHTYGLEIKLGASEGKQTVSASLSAKVEVDGDPVVVEWDKGEVLVAMTSVEAERGGAVVVDLNIIDHVGEDGTTSADWDWAGSGQARAASDTAPSSTGSADLSFEDEIELILEGELELSGNPDGFSYEFAAEVYDQDGKKLAKDSIDVGFAGGIDEDGVAYRAFGFGKGTKESASQASAKPELL